MNHVSGGGAVVFIFSIFCLGAASAATYTLDDASSPISVSFNGSNGRMTVTVKATGTVWSQGTNGGGSTVSLSGVSQPDATHLIATGTANSYPVTISVELFPATGDLKATLGGDPAQSIPNSIRYPYSFFTANGSGYAVLPQMGGYVIPTTATGSGPTPFAHNRMEWFGGTDSDWDEGWMCIADPADDMFMFRQNTTVSGTSRMGGVFEWRGSNAHNGLANRFSYDRTATYRFFASGGYVAQAKHFREFAIAKGWFKSLAEKAQANELVERLIGAPVIYLWGDGRSAAMLDAMQNAGIEKALIQLSINHVDHNNRFPNLQHANGAGWSADVLSRGWVPGIYDIYRNYRSSQTSPPYNGYFYLWPTYANPEWIYVNSDGSLAAGDVCPERASVFARDTRLPAQIGQFALEAFFFDTTCAVDSRECYDTTYGHAASRAEDIVNRANCLKAASGLIFTGGHNKLAGTEQCKSWAVPYVHWVEGQFKLGAWGTTGQFGIWNNSVYPSVPCDVVAPDDDDLAKFLDSGYQAPLWELVFHDAVISVQHWHVPHNKLLYCWDRADLAALIRGQAPMLHLAYNGATGSIGRAILGATDARDSKYWDQKWTNPNVPPRVMQTYDSVCAFHGEVGMLEMIDHRILQRDGSNNYIVQMSEFSDNGGDRGKGVVVNFGVYDGEYDVTGPTWNGSLRGTELSVPVNTYAAYSWGDWTPPSSVENFLEYSGD